MLNVKNTDQTSENNPLNSFQPGTSGVCAEALLKLRRILVEVSNLYGEQIEDTAKVGSQIATLSSNLLKDSGEDTFFGTLCQSIGGLAGGLANVYGGMKQYNSFNINEDEINSTQTQIEDLNTTKTRLDDIPTETVSSTHSNDHRPANTYENIERKVKNGDSAFNDDELKTVKLEGKTDEFKSEIDKSIEQKRAQINRLEAEAHNKSQAKGLQYQGLSKLLESGGQAAQAPFQKDAAIAQAEKALAESAKHLADSCLEQAKTQASQYMNSAIEIIKDRIAIEQSNQARS